VETRKRREKRREERRRKGEIEEKRARESERQVRG
jgi:hypothetical protein